MKTKIYLLLLVFYTGTTILNAQSTKVPPVLDPKEVVEKDKKNGKTENTANFDLKAHTDSLAQLQAKSTELSMMAQKVRTDSKGKSESVKKLLMAEASNLDQQSQVVQIAASNLSSRINTHNFNKNKTTIKGYVTKVGEDKVPVYTKNLIFDSEKIMRLAKEMREEANAQPNVASKLGTMSNADEQEEVALGKQLEALTTLEKLSSSSISGRK